MRVIGPVESHRGLGLQDHFCWVHDDPVDYRARLTEFLTEGLERGLRLGYAGSGRVGALREHLEGLDDLQGLLARDAVRIISFDGICTAGEPVDPAEVLKSYAAATDEALADGYCGLRVSADMTDIVRTPEQQDAVACYEFLLERYTSRRPLSAMARIASSSGTR